MRPFVLAPHTKNVPASSQNARVRDAIASAGSGASAADRDTTASAGRPYGRSPRSSGRSRMKISTTTNTIAAAPATSSAAARHPCDSTSCASEGRKISCPVALAADNIPRTRPRRSSNQRLAMMAASTIDVTPVPVPTSTPQSSVSCHCDCICVVNATDAESRATAARITRRTPQRSITDAANGPMMPKSAMLIATAEEMTARLQPNSRSSATISTPGVARTPAVTRMTTNVTTATTQA